MKTYNNLFDKIVNLDNLHLAERKARKGKSKNKEVVEFTKNKTENLLLLYSNLKNNNYNTSKYTHFTIFEPKERKISKMSYTDNIVHHSILNILEPIFMNMFIHQTYSCIKGRGILKCSKTIKKYLQDVKNTRYCLKLDISKFYKSVNNDILKYKLRKLIRDEKLINLLNLTIDKSEGLTLGVYTSQWLGNFYLNSFDHWIKRDNKVKYYTRYSDDIVILHSDKEYLHQLRKDIQNYLEINLKLKFSNYQVFKVESRGIDYVGYKHFHTHTLLRNSIKKRWIKMLKKNPNIKSKVAYNGWLKYANTINLQNKYLKNDK